jgi:hypothetical protein
MPLTIQLHPSESQTAFNLKRWQQLLADPELARLPFRVETDRHGHILMSPPPAPAHGKKQNRIGTPPEIRESSELCPQFPPLIQLLERN